jgi:uncharacterized protein YprB with RNaseH-like and TPR domain
MASLADKLKSLGVDVGTDHLDSTKLKKRADYPIESVLSGHWQATKHGETFVVEKRYPADTLQGCIPLRLTAPLEIIAAWANEPGLADLEPESFAFIDTETTGLMGGTGTYTFLIGVGRFEGDEFRVVQFFLRDPAEETAQLAALEAFLAPCQAFVSFNGKAFDLPLINTRYILHHWPPPSLEAGHLDLLHLARRLWRNRLPSRSLGDLETKILNARRSEKDVPGWMVADLYFDYLHTGDARPLQGVFYHNEMDVVSMAALLNHIANNLADPFNSPIEYGLDLIAIGKLYADLGHLDVAAQIYQRGLAYDDVHKEAYWEALHQLSFIHKRRSNLTAAMDLWEQAAAQGHIYAHVELAKVFEHKRKDFGQAAQWTLAAIEKVNATESTELDQAFWLPELEHRLARLQRKLEKYFQNNQS